MPAIERNYAAVSATTPANTRREVPVGKASATTQAREVPTVNAGLPNASANAFALSNRSAGSFSNALPSAAADERHHVIEESIRLTRVEQRQDVGVLEVRSGFDFLDEPLGAQHGRQLGPQDFQGDLPVVLHVAGEIHRGHAPFTEAALDPVPVGESGRETGGDLRHRHGQFNLPPVSRIEVAHQKHVRAAALHDPHAAAEIGRGIELMDGEG